MQTALTADGTSYEASAFAELTAGQRAGLAEGLRCPECGGPAFFRRRSRDGRAPCFGARPHAEDCTLRSQVTEDLGERELPEEAARIAQVGVWKVRPIDDGPRQHVENVPGEETDPDGRGRSFTAPGEGGTSTPTRGLNVLLRMLVDDVEFRGSTDTMILPDDAQGVVREMCVHAYDVNPELHRGRRRFYWGSIRYAAHANGAWFLNTVKPHPTLVVRDEKMAELLTRIGIGDAEDLVGGYFIVWAPLSINADGRQFLKLSESSLEWLAVMLPPEDD